MAALDAGLYSEAIRHLSKLVDGRRAAPQAFVAECYMHRAAAFRSLGRIAESIADCNRTLALDPSSIQALETRSALFETIRCLPEVYMTLNISGSSTTRSSAIAAFQVRHGVAADESATARSQESSALSP